MEQSKAITSQRAPKAVGSYPHARRTGDLLFLSGVGPRSPQDGSVPGNQYDEKGMLISYDIEAQCRAVFRNIRAILEDAEASWDSIVDVTVFLTNMEKDFAAFNALYVEAFSENSPTRTTIEVGALPTPIAVELKVIAALSKDR